MSTSAPESLSVAAPASPFLDDAGLAERIIGHLDRGTTDLAPATWSEPAGNYLSAERVRTEIELIRRLPVPFCPSAALPEAGSYLARASAGIGLVAVRDQAGVARVFKNACRHRGTAVAAGCGHAAALSCPFHGWVYRLDGTLRHIPDAHGFPGFDREANGLVEVPSVERGGLIVVDQEGGSDLARADLPPALPGDLSLLSQSSDRVHANWKVLVEGFLEGYHIKATHRETFLPFGFDNVNVVELHGRHSRVTFPFRRIDRVRDIAPTERVLSGLVTRVVCLFPNVIIAELSHHITMVVLEPIDAGATDFVTYQLGPAGGGAERAAAAAKDLSFVQQGAIEDRNMALAVQRGLETGANTHVTFGRFEGALTHFHQCLHAALGDSRSPSGR